MLWPRDFLFLPPYRNMERRFMNGINFAVAGSTALPYEELAAKHIISPVTMSSLNVQLDWMSSYFNSICLEHRDCAEKLQSAVFTVDEIGGNDYNYAILQGKSMDEEVIKLGATRVIIPGNFPIGCLPIYQTAFQSITSTAYDSNQCLKELNEFATYHNKELQRGIDKLKQEYPNAVIVYGDYYNAYGYLLQVGRHYEFETLKACCGQGGKYRFNMQRMCGAPDVPVCRNPERYVSWDGVHLTQRWYKIMAGWLMNNIIPSLHCHL